jgi:hypothetical protein
MLKLAEDVPAKGTCHHGNNHEWKKGRAGHENDARQSVRNLIEGKRISRYNAKASDHHQ